MIMKFDSENTFIFKKFFSQLLGLNHSLGQTNQVYSNDDKGVYQNCIFMNQGQGFLCFGRVILVL